MDFLLSDSLSRLLDWRAPLEILIITLGLYVLYRNLTAMGAWKIVVGILIGLGVFASARFLGLKGIEWVLSHFSGVALIGLIVLFQPEIRRIFERAASFRRPEPFERRSRLNTLLADVLFDLVRRKWGAIVVIPGKESLAPWTTTAIPLDATPTYPLLTSIFDAGSPGHDGAVVVDNGRLASFGVRLPLSGRGSLPEEYGTRHHAALGLSEKTDALILVVSEERQTVTAFIGGKHHAVHNPEQVVEQIHDHWERTLGTIGPALASTGRRIRSGPLIGSLIVSTLLWMSIVPQRGEALEMSFSVPVEYTAAPANMTVVGDRVDRVRMLVSGAASDLSLVDPSLLRVRADLSTAVSGEQLIPLALGNVELPRGVRLVDIEPASLALEVAPLIEKELPIRPQLIGNPPAGFVVGEVQVRPVSLRVLLPQGRTDVPEEILTAPIHMTGVQGTTRVLSTVMVPSGIRPAGERWPDVVVSVTVEPAESE